jgi:hypothetical protein
MFTHYSLALMAASFYAEFGSIKDIAHSRKDNGKNAPIIRSNKEISVTKFR